MLKNIFALSLLSKFWMKPTKFWSSEKLWRADFVNYKDQTTFFNKIIGHS